jgi:hypothetical protein
VRAWQSPPAYFDQMATGWFCCSCLSHIREARSWPRSTLAWWVNSLRHLPLSHFPSHSLTLSFSLILSLSLFFPTTPWGPHTLNLIARTWSPTRY